VLYPKAYSLQCATRWWRSLVFSLSVYTEIRGDCNAVDTTDFRFLRCYSGFCPVGDKL
jgi:hypothetical protein